VLDLGRLARASPCILRVCPGFVVLVLWLFWNRCLDRRKIQRRAWSRDNALREIVASLRSVLIFSLVTTAVQLGADAGLFTIQEHCDVSETAYLLGTVAAMIVAQDTYFYWSHRLMHHRLMFRRFHRTHHKSVTPTAFAAYAFDAPEALMHGLFVPLWLLVIPMHQTGLVVFLAIMVLRNAVGHCGVELLPGAAGRPGGWLGWISPNAHHDLHHTAMGYNYGLYFTWWDRLMGTEHPKYHEQMLALSEARPSTSDSAVRV
jgi:Delta7-sterol 5-desaturase